MSKKLPTRGEPAGIFTIIKAMKLIKSPTVMKEFRSVGWSQLEDESKEAYNSRLIMEGMYIIMTNLDVVLPAIIALDGSVTAEELENVPTDQALAWVRQVIEENKPNATAFGDFLSEMMGEAKEESPASTDSNA